MHRFATTLIGAALCALLGLSSVARAQVPVPTTSTPTIHGGTPIDGAAVHGEIGYAALRAAGYFGLGRDRDIGIEASLPTFGGTGNSLPGWNQNVGIDLRAPFRLKLLDAPKASGALKVGPYFHVGNICSGCDARSIGLGVLAGFVTDIPLPKIFKLIVGLEQQLGFVNVKADGYDGDTGFAGATWVDAGLEAFWKDIFFTLLFNVGAQYGEGGGDALFRQMVGAGYKWR
jgi:hypothetical protein